MFDLSTLHLLVGAGHFPRHVTGNGSSKASGLHVEGQVGSGFDSSLHHADWGIRQWIPFLVG